MTKKRYHFWLNERKDEELRKWIIRDRKKIAGRLSERELALLLDTFDATGYSDHYGTLEEYLLCIYGFVQDSIRLQKDIAKHLEIIGRSASTIKKLHRSNHL